MLRLCYGPLDCCFGRRGGRRADGLLWHTDLKPHASGDFSIAVAQANYSLEDQSQVFTSPSATYVGVYDGHGGPEASRFVNKRLFPYLHSNSSIRPSVNPSLFFSLRSGTSSTLTLFFFSSQFYYIIVVEIKILNGFDFF